MGCLNCHCWWMCFFMIIKASPTTLGRDKIAQNLRIIMFELQYSEQKCFFCRWCGNVSIEFFCCWRGNRCELQWLNACNNRAVNWKRRLPPIACLHKISKHCFASSHTKYPNLLEATRSLFQSRVFLCTLIFGLSELWHLTTLASMV